LKYSCHACHAAHASAKKPNLTLAGQEVIDEESITIANAMTLCAFFPVTALFGYLMMVAKRLGFASLEACKKGENMTEWNQTGWHAGMLACWQLACARSLLARPKHRFAVQ
jgi:hypothetical protein